MRAAKSTTQPGPVLVGVDGSASARAAVDLGAWEAKRRRVPLLLVHGYQDELPHATYGLVTRAPVVSAVRDGARSMLEDIENRTHAAHPGLTVRSTLVGGGGASSLVELSRGASLVVVGCRGSGGFAGLLIGSVGAQVAMYSHAPVIVVRPPGGPGTPVADAPVVVGVDGSSSSTDVLGFAFDEARHRGVPLVAVHATRDQAPGADPAGALADTLAAWAEKFPDVPVIPVVRPTEPAPALIEASRDAGLIVVGNRGHGGFARLLLGSVSHALIGHAACPVAVVRPVMP
jgi:nucleotide-binding universal stress UspA family protein